MGRSLRAGARRATTPRARRSATSGGGARRERGCDYRVRLLFADVESPQRMPQPRARFLRRVDWQRTEHRRLKTRDRRAQRTHRALARSARFSHSRTSGTATVSELGVSSSERARNSQMGAYLGKAPGDRNPRIDNRGPKSKASISGVHRVGNRRPREVKQQESDTLLREGDIRP